MPFHGYRGPCLKTGNDIPVSKRGREAVVAKATPLPRADFVRAAAAAAAAAMSTLLVTSGSRASQAEDVSGEWQRRLLEAWVLNNARCGALIALQRPHLPMCWYVHVTVLKRTHTCCRYK